MNWLDCCDIFGLNGAGTTSRRPEQNARMAIRVLPILLHAGKYRFLSFFSIHSPEFGLISILFPEWNISSVFYLLFCYFCSHFIHYSPDRVLPLCRCDVSYWFRCWANRCLCCELCYGFRLLQDLYSIFDTTGRNGKMVCFCLLNYQSRALWCSFSAYMCTLRPSKS